MKKKRKSSFTAEDWARSDRAKAMVEERIAYYEQLEKNRKAEGKG
jgi:hypothetical protein